MVETPQLWRSAGWRLIREQVLSPAQNVAVDEVLLNAAASNNQPPTLRFWRWAAPAVVIGRFQSLSNEVDCASAAAMGISIVRRISGGGAMFVRPDEVVTYSVYFPEQWVARRSIRDSYAACDGWAVDVLRELGVDAFHAPINDIACLQGKIGGAAQVRRDRQVLHHTTIAYEMNSDDMRRVLRIGRERLSSRGTPSAAKEVSPLRRHIDLQRSVVVERLIARFRERFGAQERELTAEELSAADAAVQERFGLDSWTAEIP